MASKSERLRAEENFARAIETLQKTLRTSSTKVWKTIPAVEAENLTAEKVDDLVESLIQAPVALPGTLICQCLSLLTEAIDKELRREQDFNKSLDRLAVALRRIQLRDTIPAEFDHPQKDGLECAALELCASVCNYLTISLKYLRRSFVGNIFRFNQDELSSALGDIESKSRAVSDAAIDFHVATGIETLQQIKDIKKSIAAHGDVQAHQNRFKAWLERSIEAITRDWSINFKLQQEGSSPPTYLFDLAECKEWLEENPRSKILWLSAPSGYGKSVVSAYAVHDLRQHFPVAYFFCKDNETQCEAYQMVGAFLSQLISKFPQIREDVMALWESDNSISEPEAGVENLAKAVIAVGKMLSLRLFFVVDGINECPSESLKSIVQFIHHLGQSDGDIRVMLTSQPKAEITSGLGDSIQCVLGEQNCGTIHSYIEHTLDDTMKRLFQKCDIEPNEYFQARHNGMFIWVSTVLMYLQDHADSVADFEEILSQVPDDMNELYLNILKRLESELKSNEKAWLTEILTWLSLCQRPLSLAELEVGINYSRNVRSGTKIVADSFPNFEKTLSKYGAIVKLGSQGGVKFVSLSHDSFKQFVTDEICKSQFHVDKDVSNRLLAAACSAYLVCQDIPLMDDFTLPAVHRLKIEHQSPLFSYATNYWSAHLTASVTPSVGTSQTRFPIETQMKILEAGHFQTWLLNCLKYDRTVDYGPGFVPRSLLASLQDVDRWLKYHHLTFNTRKGRLAAIQTTETSEFLTTLREIVIRTWLSLDPGSRLASGSAFALAQKLITEGATDPIELAALGTETEALTGSGTSGTALGPAIAVEKGLWHANIGHGFSYYWSSHESLQLAGEHYKLSRSYLNSRSALVIACCISEVLFRDRQLTGSLEKLEEDIKGAREVIEMMSDGDRWLPRYLILLAGLLYCSYDVSKEVACLDEAIEIARRTVEITEDGPEKAGYEAILAEIIRGRYSVTKAQPDIDEATELLERAISHNRQGLMEATTDIKKCLTVIQLGGSLFDRYCISKDVGDLNGAIECIERVIHEFLPVATPEQVPQLADLLVQTYYSNKSVEDTSALLEGLYSVWESTTNKPVKAFVAVIIGRLTLGKFTSQGDTGVEELANAVSYGKQALEISRDLANPGLIQEATRSYLMLQNAIFDQALTSTTMDDYQEAIELGRELVAMKPVIAEAQMQLCAFLVAAWAIFIAGVTGNLSDAQECFDIAEEKLNTHPLGLSTLHCLFLLLRFRLHHSPSDVEDALRRLRAARKHPVAIFSPPHKAKFAYMYAFAVFLFHRDQGWAKEVDKCIRERQTSVQTPDPATRLPRLKGVNLGMLSGLLQLRAKSTHSLADLDEAICYGIDAVGSFDENPLFALQKASCASVVAEGFLLHYKWTRNDEDFKSATEFLKNALGWTPEGHPDRVRYLNLYRELPSHIGKFSEREEQIKGGDYTKMKILISSIFCLCIAFVYYWFKYPVVYY